MPGLALILSPPSPLSSSLFSSLSLSVYVSLPFWQLTVDRSKEHYRLGRDIVVGTRVTKKVAHIIILFAPFYHRNIP